MPSPTSHPGGLPVLSPSDRDAREHVAGWLGSFDNAQDRHVEAGAFSSSPQDDPSRRPFGPPQDEWGLVGMVDGPSRQPSGPPQDERDMNFASLEAILREARLSRWAIPSARVGWR